MKKLLLLALMCVALSVAGTAQAAYTVGTDAGTLNTTTALTGFATNGAMMDGLLVTAFFTGGSSQQAVWGDTGATSGEAVGTGWSLSESGDTFGGIWRLVNGSGLGIERVLIDAGPGDTVYDTGFGSDTPGSFGGWAFSVTGGSDAGLDIKATYRSLVALNGNPPAGDLYRFLDIDFTARGPAFASGRSALTYITDTDNIRFAGDLRPVPEPAALAIWGVMAGIGLIVVRRKRKQAA